MCYLPLIVNLLSPFIQLHTLEEMFRFRNMISICTFLVNLDIVVWFGLWCLTPLLTIFQLYRGIHSAVGATGPSCL